MTNWACRRSVKMHPDVVGRAIEIHVASGRLYRIQIDNVRVRVEQMRPWAALPRIGDYEVSHGSVEMRALPHLATELAAAPLAPSRKLPRLPTGDHHKVGSGGRPSWNLSYHRVLIP